MAAFHYQGFTATGDLAEGEIEAPSRQRAEDSLWSRGLTPIDVRAISDNSYHWRSWFRPRAPHQSELAGFTREFATLAQAGIPLDRALRILERQTGSKIIRALAEGLLADVNGGASMSQAMAARPKIFAAEYLNIARAGEATGDISGALSDLAHLLERRVELHARLRGALVYPALLIVLALASTAIVLTSLVPAIAPIFADSGKPMPAGLAVVISLGDYWAWIFASLTACLVAFALFLRWTKSNPEARRGVDRLKLRIPFVGPMIAQAEAARFARALGAMLHAGVPMLAALGAARDIIANTELGAGFDAASEAVRGGATLAQSISAMPILPPVLVQVVAVGEESGKLDVMLSRTALMFERQTERQIEQAMGLLTPALTILIAAIVGGLILSVMNAVLGINDLAAQ